MISYKTLIYDEKAIMNLYLDNEWYAYTNIKETLFEGIKNSLDVIGAYKDKELVGLIRTIGDKKTIIYIQDILVLKSYHRKGIGTSLLDIIINKYPHVRQMCLMTGESKEQRQFYESLGFISYDKGEWINKVARNANPYLSFSPTKSYANQKTLFKHANFVKEVDEVQKEFSVVFGQDRKMPYISNLFSGVINTHFIVEAILIFILINNDYCSIIRVIVFHFKF